VRTLLTRDFEEAFTRLTDRHAYDTDSAFKLGEKSDDPLGCT